MTTRTSTRIAGLAAALLASLVLAPTALAVPTAFSVANGKLVPQSTPSQRGLAPDRADKIGIATQGSSVGIPDRVDKIGILTQGTAGVPDRVDKLGTTAGPGPVVVVSTSAPSTGSSMWHNLDAVAAALLALSLLVALGTFAGRKRSGGVAPAR